MCYLKAADAHIHCEKLSNASIDNRKIKREQRNWLCEKINNNEILQFRRNIWVIVAIATARPTFQISDKHDWYRRERFYSQFNWRYKY